VALKINSHLPDVIDFGIAGELPHLRANFLCHESVMFESACCGYSLLQSCAMAPKINSLTLQMFDRKKLTGRYIVWFRAIFVA
jgi:hypothetical protein